jgi:hypothetical protein
MNIIKITLPMAIFLSSLTAFGAININNLKGREQTLREDQRRREAAERQARLAAEERQLRESGAETWLDPVSGGLFFRQPGETPGSFILTPTQNGIPPQIHHQNTNH